jgi:hypothetical protein
LPLNKDSTTSVELPGQDRERLRGFYVEVWRKVREGLPMEPLEALVAGVIRDHPEYHALLDSPDSLYQDFSPESSHVNPFLHMGLHVAIQEQVAADRPPGIRQVCRHLLVRYPSAHALEHGMMECLADSLWQAQRAGRSPDEAAYLECVRRLRTRGTA